MFLDRIDFPYREFLKVYSFLTLNPDIASISSPCDLWVIIQYCRSYYTISGGTISTQARRSPFAE
jgi:hypothetical protein